MAMNCEAGLLTRCRKYASGKCSCCGLHLCEDHQHKTKPGVLRARIKNVRDVGRSHWVADVGCDICGNVETVSAHGWTAIKCLKCGAWLEKEEE